MPPAAHVRDPKCTDPGACAEIVGKNAVSCGRGPVVSHHFKPATSFLTHGERTGRRKAEAGFTHTKVQKFRFEGVARPFRDGCSDTRWPFVGAPAVTQKKRLEGANLPHEKRQQRVTPAFVGLHRFVHSDAG